MPCFLRIRTRTLTPPLLAPASRSSATAAPSTKTILISALDGVDILGIRSKTEVTRKVIEARPDLLAIGTFSIGTNQIDLEAATNKGVAVFNAPYSNTRSVAWNSPIGEIISLSRRLPVQNDALHKGIWEKSAAGSHEVRGRTLGIIGFGNIGMQLSVVAEALGMRVVFYDTAEKLVIGNARRINSLEELLEVADVVTIHVDGRASNKNFFGEEQFKLIEARRYLPQPVPRLPRRH